MEQSKFNIVSKIKNSDKYYIINILNGNADILEPGEIDLLNHPEDEKALSFIEKGYLVDASAEEKKYRKEYLNFLEKRDSSEVQIFFVANYSCNFSCTYCYQESYAPEKSGVTEEIIDAFISYITKEFHDRKIYITIFGGEPLLPGEKQKNIIQYLIDKATDENIDLAIVTNGYNLKEYADILSRGKIREVQVTLDGTEEIHNNRRPLKNGQSTFDSIVEGIDEILKRNIAVNLRVVVDKDNMKNLPELAEFAIQKGWTNHSLFKTQLGRNYELHTCQVQNSQLYEREELHEALYEILQKNPSFADFFRPSFSIARELHDNGELPGPLFDACPGCKTEWAFDYTGRIYPCTATVGKEGESVGTFYPAIIHKNEIIDEWEDRDVTSIAECRSCPVQHACGGGCGSVAKNKNGKLSSPDCRPVKELIGMGISYYFNKGEV